MFDCIFRKWSSPVFQPTLSLAENRSYTQANKSFKTTWAVIEKKNLSSGCQHFPLSLRLCPVPLFKQRTSNTEMKIPSLCNVYSAFSHIPHRSVHNLPPLFTIFPDASSLEPAIDCRWKGRLNREDGNEAEGGGRQEVPAGTRGRLSGLVLLSDHAGPHVHSSPWRRRVRGCSGSAMGRDHVWADNGFLLN